jgi:murein DD-endopeptidase MepM/ murein hydrolase activator NlpD
MIFDHVSIFGPRVFPTGGETRRVDLRKFVPAVGFLSLAALSFWQAEQLKRSRLESQEFGLQLAQQQALNSRLRRDHELRWLNLADQLQQSRTDIERLRAQMRPLALVRRPSLASRRGRTLAFRPLDIELLQQTQELRELGIQAEQRARSLPLGPPCVGPMTSPFGPRVHPIYGIGRPHLGCDFTVPEGTPIRATADGKVTHADWLGGYGQVVEVEHGFGVKTLFAHCSRLKVAKGQSVRRGDWIADVGVTGLASGPHCHYEVHLGGRPIDPGPFLTWKR